MRAHRNFDDDLKRGWYKESAFMLHQATERLYHCVLLVCTFYTPHVHNLGFLRTQAERIDMRIVDAWPRELKADRKQFEKLKEAYVKERSEEHTSELQSLMRTSYAVFCLKTKTSLPSLINTALTCA